jgi:hypothetical protein
VPVQPVERKLAAIFAADVAGYSRLMARDEIGTLTRLKACRVIMDGLIASHRAASSTPPATASSPTSQARSMPCNVPSRCKRRSRARMRSAGTWSGLTRHRRFIFRPVRSFTARPKPEASPAGPLPKRLGSGPARGIRQLRFCLCRRRCSLWRFQSPSLRPQNLRPIGEAGPVSHPLRRSAVARGICPPSLGIHARSWAASIETRRGRAGKLGRRPPGGPR